MAFFCTLLSKCSIMKLFCSFLLIVLTSGLFAQDSIELINTAFKFQTPILYRGFNNTLKIVAPEGDHHSFSLIGTGCMLARQDDIYVVKPGNADSVTLTIVMGGAHEQKSLVGKKTYKVMNLPDPSLHVNTQLATSQNIREAQFFELKYLPEVPLSTRFEVTSWMMLVNGEIHTGNNHIVTQNVAEILKTSPKGTKIQISLNVLGPDGITRKYAENFELED